MSDWKYIDEYESLPDTDFIHCDTRDFHIICTSVDKEYRKEVEKGIQKYMNSWSECKFSKSEILKVLKELEIRSGGKGRWRLISTESHPNWLKYIRFIKTNKVINGEPVYIAYSSMGNSYEVLSHKLLSEPINEEFLSHVSSNGKYSI